MKSFTLKTTHLVLFETGAQFLGTLAASYKIYELVDEQGQSHFSFGDLGHIADMVNIPGISNPDFNRILPKARNLLEAQASIIELIISKKSEFDTKKIPSISDWLLKKLPPEPIDFRPLMRELKDLPLLMGFFTNPVALKTFEEVLKNG